MNELKAAPNKLLAFYLERVREASAQRQVKAQDNAFKLARHEQQIKLLGQWWDSLLRSPG